MPHEIAILKFSFFAILAVVWLADVTQTDNNRGECRPYGSLSHYTADDVHRTVPPPAWRFINATP